ncbi:MAG: VWA domain-containing protein [Planctomycetes bacterium]|nr:VWA domain-containing protein [Planctomycetota bacterium]
MQFKQYDAFYLLFVLVFPVIPIYVWCFWRKRKALNLLAQADLLKTINPSASLSKQISKSLLLTVAFAAIVVALTRPAWNPTPQEVKHKGRDVVILLDTSRSMLADDIKPNRLERAKLAIGDLMETIRGDRIGIITFAGSASAKCPLTQDYAFVRMALDQITTESTPKGGTNVGDAIRKAVNDVFDEQAKEYKDIILITDCDDLEESFPVQAAEKAGQKGIRIIAVGLGSPDEGARIPIVESDGTKTFLKYQGQEVWTKLDEQTLRQVSAATPGGAYIPVKTGTFDLGQIYNDLVFSAQRRDLESTTVLEYEEKFQIFLALALILIVTEEFISERKRM